MSIASLEAAVSTFPASEWELVFHKLRSFFYIPSPYLIDGDPVHGEYLVVMEVVADLVHMTDGVLITRWDDIRGADSASNGVWSGRILHGSLRHESELRE